MDMLESNIDNDANDDVAWGEKQAEAGGPAS
jgi:hypothetical protein